MIAFIHSHAQKLCSTRMSGGEWWTAPATEGITKPWQLPQNGEVDQADWLCQVKVISVTGRKGDVHAVIDDAAGIGDLLPDLECVGPKHGGDERKLFVLCQSHKRWNCPPPSGGCCAADGPPGDG